MYSKKTFTLLATITSFTVLMLLVLATPAQAQEGTEKVDNGNCITCHEQLYYLHDTGNWFCICESPMRCVDCHGGNPAATTEETAHYDRSAHPVINEDISRCETCHVEECADRVNTLDKKVRISEVKEATYIPVSSVSNPTESLPAANEPKPVDWVLVFEIVPVVILGVVALTIYLVNKFRQA